MTDDELFIKQTEEDLKRIKIPRLRILTALQKALLAKDIEFQNLLVKVRDELKSKFFGTYATVEVTQYRKNHLQLLMFLYREEGWHVSSLVDEGKEYLRFRDPRSINGREQ